MPTLGAEGGHADGRIDFRASSRSVYNLVRALARPYPGAHAELGGKEGKIWRVIEKPCALSNIEPGKVLAVDSQGIVVKCGENSVVVLEHEFRQLPKPGEYFQ